MILKVLVKSVYDLERFKTKNTLRYMITITFDVEKRITFNDIRS